MLTKKHINYIMTDERLTARQKQNAIKKAELQDQEYRNQKPVKSMVLTITWKDSRTWGANPHVEAKVRYVDGCYAYGKATCSGCGYDKESTVIADMYNAFLRYKLYKKRLKKAPYGISGGNGFYPYYSGGVGTSCYYDITKFIGGKLVHVASGKSFDVYEVTIK